LRQAKQPVRSGIAKLGSALGACQRLNTIGKPGQQIEFIISIQVRGSAEAVWNESFAA
jgi:hypothetical protein